MSVQADGKRNTAQIIRKTPNVLGGDACIGDRRIAVWMLVRDKQLGLTDEQVKNGYLPPLDDEEFQAAWKYYQDNREEIEQAVGDNENE